MKYSAENIISYIEGNLRYKLYYSILKFLIPLHIREQIEVRINSMYQDCFDKGSCIKCGCTTTQLQMANKACDGNCYPKMQNKKNWNLLKNNKIIISNKLAWQVRNSKFKKFEL